MCGILGIISQDSKNLIEKSNQKMAHRGPDSEGYFNFENLSLAHKRLSIIELSPLGHQPMVSSCNNFVLVFNGEIYNHLDIRKEFLPNHKFNSHSDTETLLYAFIKHGKDILNHLNGIFSFAIFNKQTKEITIVRDHYGIKPLYYYVDNEMFWFSSEIKTILKTNFNSDISIESFANYLTFLYSPGEKTPFKHVLKLLPGHLITFNISSHNDFKIEKYYEIPFDGTTSTKTESELINELEKLLLKSVERQMLADVPVGFFLSGGLDSSALVAMAKKIYPEKKFNCYTIKTNDGQDMDEGFVNDLAYARKVAKHLNVNLIEVESNVNIVREFDKMIYHLDEPQADPAPLSVLHICQQARKDGQIVLIGGTAGDDLFSGYRRHQALNFEKYFKFIPIPLGKLLKMVIFKLPSNSAFSRRLRKLTENIDLSKKDRLVGYFSWINKTVINSLFSSKNKTEIQKYDPLFYHKSILKNIPNEKDLLNQMLYLEMKTFLVDHNLNYTDKMSMATGVEVRVPFLDKELLEFSTKIPTKLKLNGMTTKYILKKVMEKYLPHDVIYRPKSGFGAPVRDWITRDMDDTIKKYLSKEMIQSRNIFNFEEIQNLIENNKTGKIDASYTIWCLLSIESWMQQFYDKTNK
jgi:asparagine synthase (glutamine-hydrolysing)